MKNKIICFFLIIVILSFSCAFSGGNPGGSKSPGHSKSVETSSYNGYFANYPPLTKLTTRKDIINLIDGTVYYLDAVSGNNDTGDGSSSNPWQTLSKVKGILQDGDAVILRDGNYGEFNDKDEHNDWIVIINEEGASPVLTNISLRNNEVSPLPSLKLIFYGITITPEWVDPADPEKPGSDDPQYVASTMGTYTKTAYPVGCKNMQDVKFYNCEVIGQSKHLTDRGFDFCYTNNVTVEGCYMHVVTRGINLSHVKNTSIYYNRIENIAGSYIKEGGKSLNTVIEGNYGCNSNWNASEDYAPRADGKGYHGSSVSIRSPNIIIRNNIFHDGCNSSGMMLYAEYDVYNNVLIENNLIYDVHNDYVFRIYNLGTNVVIRNNIFVGRGNDKNSEPGRYNTALALHSVAGSSSKLSLYNNIFVGSVCFGSYKGQVDESHNIYWSLLDKDDNELTADQINPTSCIVGDNPGYFETGFFNGTLDVSPGHGNVIDFTLSSSSEAINFGNPKTQPTTSLGSVDGDGFLGLAKATRDTNHYSVGCYER